MLGDEETPKAVLQNEEHCIDITSVLIIYRSLARPLK